MRQAPTAALLAASLLALSLLAAPAAARGASFVVEKGSMRIRHPAIAGSIDTAVGDFGVPLYGGTLSGAVAFDSSNAQGCREFAPPLAPLPSGLPIVLLVDRGDCFFVEKARYAQRAGASALLITDHTEARHMHLAGLAFAEPLLTMAVPEDRPEVAALVPEIQIPVLLVTKGTGDKIKAALQGGGSGGGAPAEVQVELDWSESIAHPDNRQAVKQGRVEWELWFTTQDACGQACNSTRAFLSAFKATAEALERVVEQNKRHLCAYQVLNQSQQEPWRWWDYAAGFAASCTMAAGRYDTACAEEVLRAKGVDVTAVNACMGPSNTDTTHPLMEAQRTKQLDEEHSGRGRVLLLPTLVINTDQYRGSLTAPAVLRALCSGYAEGTEPSVCLAGGLNVDDCSSGADSCWRGGTDGRLSACVDTFRGYVCRCPPGYEGDGRDCADVDECALKIDGCDQICVNTPGSYRCECHKGYTLHGGQGAPGMCLPNSLSPSRLPAWLIAMLIVASVVAVSVAGLFVYRWKLRREMQLEIRSIMREYLPVSGTDADRAEAAALREALLPRTDASHPASGSKGKGRGRGGRGTAGAGMGGGEEEGSLNNMAGGADVEAGGTGGTVLPLTPDGGSWAARRLTSPPALTELTDVSSPLHPRRL
ncbi:Vacuolar-sorting receptor 1 [Chlorella vulgaris]